MTLYTFLAFLLASLVGILTLIGSVWYKRRGDMPTTTADQYSESGTYLMNEREPLSLFDPILSRIPDIEEKIATHAHYIYGDVKRYMRSAALRTREHPQTRKLVNTVRDMIRGRRLSMRPKEKYDGNSREQESRFFKTIAEHKENIRRNE